MSNSRHPTAPGLVLVPLDDGNAVSDRTMTIIEAIRRYHPRLDVKWISPGQRAPGEPQFCVTETVNGKDEIVFHVQDEAHFDGRVLERIISSDHTRTDIMGEIDARNAAVKALQQQEELERQAEWKDKMIHALKSPLHKYTIEPGLVIRDNGDNV